MFMAPFALWLIWTALIRWPFAFNFDEDEPFFSVVATRWLSGELPYVNSFDVKPPLLFAIYALTQSLFGASPVVLKGLEVFAVAAGAMTLYRLVLAHGTRPAALWAALLYPIYSLSLSGVNAPNTLIQLPFIILAFDCMLTVSSDRSRTGLKSVFIAGVLIGAATMIKQTAIFEAAALGGLCLFSSDLRSGIRPGIWPDIRPGIWRLALFATGAALLPVVFALYFTLNGHFAEFFFAVFIAASGRLQGDAITVSGVLSGAKISYWEGCLRLIPLTKPLFFLVGCSVLTLTRFDIIKTATPSRYLKIYCLWLLAAVIGVIALRSMYAHYAMSLIPPLLILSGAFVAHGLKVKSAWKPVCVALLVAGAVLVPVYLSREALAHSHLDIRAAEKMTVRITQAGLQKDDRILALDRSLMVNVLTGHMPDTPYFHPQHLFCAFPTAVSDPLMTAMAGKPRFIVVADQRISMACEAPNRMDRIMPLINERYDYIGEEKGDWDILKLYRLKPRSDVIN